MLRPSVTFFGEPLPQTFVQRHFEDVSTCDLLLVFGTSLQVYPVAAIPNMIGPQAVRLLINRDATGCFQGIEPFNEQKSINGLEDEAQKSSTSDSRWNTPGYRDVFYRGDCDDGAAVMASSLGLLGEFDEIVRRWC